MGDLARSGFWPHVVWPNGKHAERDGLLRELLASTQCDYHGTVIILDGMDYAREEQSRCRPLQGFGNYWNTINAPAFSRHNGPNMKCPEYLESIQGCDDYQHFIWISRSVAFGDDNIRFFWVAAHESRHYQVACDPTILATLPAMSQEAVPADADADEVRRCVGEIACDLYACGLVVARYGRSAALNYSRDQASKYREAAARADRPDAIAVRQHDAMRYDFIASRWLPATFPE